MRVQVRTVFLLLFFGAQVLGVCCGLFTDTKYFNWVPYDEIAHYEIEVQLPERALSAEEIERRYRKSARGRENRDIDNLLSLIRQYERTYGANDRARIRVTYHINATHERVWNWPK